MILAPMILKAKGANTQSKAFEVFCEASIILTLTNRAITKSADIYADLKRRGSMFNDADILMGVSPLLRNIDLLQII